ncbi:MAG: hypothetical protein CVT48_00360 [Thermoplasmata archaeon HGW-Thermoplasmata-1]|nr:MAG: hypothetical protein CVT48_00360 [Thermoplasmata archaeon HGW-Thermoplasmata-1]
MSAGWKYIVAVECFIFAMVLLAMGAVEVAHTGEWIYRSGSHEYIYDMVRHQPNYSYFIISTVLLSVSAVVIRRERKKQCVAKANERHEKEGAEYDGMLGKLTCEARKKIESGAGLSHKELLEWAAEMDRYEAKEIVLGIEKPLYRIKTGTDPEKWTEINGKMRRGQRIFHRAWTCAVENCPEEALATLEEALADLSDASAELGKITGR